MRLKLFRAASMAQAMAQVRSELGTEALILSSRRVADGIELTAALEPEAEETFRGGSRDASTTPRTPPRHGSARENSHSPSAAPSARRGAESDQHSPGTARPCRWPPPRPSVQVSDDPEVRGPLDRSRRDADGQRQGGLAWHRVPEAIARRIADGPLAFALTAAFRFAPLELTAFAPPVLLVGPPGAGKTLTTARLATRLVIQGIRPLVVTADGQRAGAAEQLAAFTRLLGLELLVACNPAALAHALSRREDGAPVLIDAPGTDPLDRLQAGDTTALAEAAGAVSVLVLPSGLDPAEASDVAGAYRSIGASLLIANRLDVARRLGGILAAADAGLAFAEAGIGPGAADGLVPMTPAWLAERLLQLPDRRP